jgi:hypothetical protein
VGGDAAARGRGFDKQQPTVGRGVFALRPLSLRCEPHLGHPILCAESVTAQWSARCFNRAPGEPLTNSRGSIREAER